MDMYKKDNIRRIVITIGTIVGLYLQWTGRKIPGLKGLGIQFISLAILLFSLWIYNRKFK